MKKVFIFSARIAKDLIRNNYRVIDIVENVHDKKRTVFVFKNTEKIKKYLKQKHNIKIK